ncbi:MAG: TIR domain-containing protein, partial [Anaerolineae bacterium]|nr:TIR domain-containing protein [Anaerolineae bacterium]
MPGHIFISYSKRDSEFAFKLADDLIQAGYKVWIDRQIEGGERWRTSISDALKNASEMIVVLTPNSVASRWVVHEGSVGSGLDKALYPVMAAPIGVNDLPVWMEEIQYIDFVNQGYEHGLQALIEALTPPNPLQDLLDYQVKAYQQTGELLGEALLTVIEQARDQLTIGPEAEILIEKSRQAVRLRRRLMRGGIGLVVVLVLIALGAAVAALQAGALANDATLRQQVAQTAAADAQQLADAAATQQAAAEAELNIVATQQADASASLATATAALGDAASRLAAADAELERLFSSTGAVPVGNGPRGLAWDGLHLWVINSDNTLWKIDPADGEVLATVALGDGAFPTAVLWDGTGVWVANQLGDAIQRIDPATGSIVAEIALADGAAPTALAWDGAHLWVANRGDDTVQRIDPASQSIVTTIAVDDDPRAL